MNQTDPFADYYAGAEPSDAPPDPNDPLAEYYADKSTLGDVPRHVARTASRAGEQVFGLAEEAASLPAQLAERFLPGSTTMLQDEGRIRGQKGAQEFMEKISNDYLKAQNEGEELSDNITKDLVDFLATRTAPMRALGLAATGNVAKKASEKLGAGEGAQEATKLGTLFLTSVLTKGKGTPALVQEAYKARDALTPDADISARGLIRGLGLVKKRAGHITTEGEKLVMQEVDALEQGLKGSGTTNARELIKESDKINKVRQSVRGNQNLTGTDKKSAERILDDLQKEIDSEVNQLGKQHPDFVKAHKDADAIYRTIEKSKEASNWLSSKLKKYGLKSGTGIGVLKALTGGGLTGGLAAAGGAGAGAALGFGGTELYKVMHQISRNPNLQRYYFDLLKNLAQENFIAADKSLKKMMGETKDDKDRSK